MLITLAEKKCAPSGFPSVPGESKLRIMVRLHIPSVKEAYDRKRVDIRYAITQKSASAQSKHKKELLPRKDEGYLGNVVADRRVKTSPSMNIEGKPISKQIIQWCHATVKEG